MGRPYDPGLWRGEGGAVRDGSGGQTCNDSTGLPSQPGRRHATGRSRGPQPTQCRRCSQNFYDYAITSPASGPHDWTCGGLAATLETGVFWGHCGRKGRGLDRDIHNALSDDRRLRDHHDLSGTKAKGHEKPSFQYDRFLSVYRLARGRRRAPAFEIASATCVMPPGRGAPVIRFVRSHDPVILPVIGLVDRAREAFARCRWWGIGNGPDSGIADSDVER